MAVNYTSLLGLAQPVSGTSAGTWGDDINDGLTALVDSAIAGTTTISASTTLSTTQGAANEARQAILLVTGTTGNITITAPNVSKVYVVSNRSSHDALLKAAASTGVTISSQTSALVVWNTDLSDFEIITSSSTLSNVSTFSAGTTGLTPNTATGGAVTLAGTLAPTNGGTGLTTLTGLAYGNGTSAFSAATGAQVVGVIGSTAVTNATNATSATTATNIAGGVANKIPYQTAANTTAFIDAPTTAGYFLSWNGSAFNWSSSVATGVTSFKTSLTGLTPTTDTTGSVTLAGTVGVASGGTGLTTLSGIAYGNGTSAFSAATGAQVVGVIGSTAVTNATNATKATNIAGGLASKIPYQTGADTTSFIDAPTVTDTYLKWNGTAFTWAASASSGVSSFKTSLSGLTPSTDTTGAVTLAGTLGVANGGTGITTLTGLAYGSGTSSFTAATAAQVVSVIGTTAVNKATNVAGGAANKITYQTAADTTSFIDAPTVTDTYLKWNGTSFTWAATAASGVSSFSAGTTGLTPSTATTGAVTLAGTLGVANGGSGTTTLTGVLYGNGTSAFTAATGAQIATAIGSNAVSVATNLAGGAANRIAYQTNAATSSFIAAPTTASTYLQWNGTAFAWAATGTVTSASVTSANGFGGSVATSTTTPAITITTSVTGLLKGDGTGVSAAVAGTDYVTPTGTATLTNKRINPRVSSTTSTATLTPDVSLYDQVCLTAQAATLTVAAPTGTPVDGTKLTIRILDNGTSRAISWNATYTAIGVTLPTATTASKTTYVGCVYNANNARWDVLAVQTQA